MTSRLPHVTVDPLQLERDPYPAFHALRSTTPVAWVEPLRMWFVTRYDDVVAVLRDPVRFTTDAPGSTIRDTFGLQMLSADGETQRRFKTACAAPFTTRAVRDRTGPVVRAEVDRLLSGLPLRDPVDLRAALAGPLALHTVAAVLGIPERHHGAIRHWYDAFAASLANFGWDPAIRAAGHAAVAEFLATIRPLLPTLAATAPDSLLGALAAAEPPPLTTDELLANALIILFGGIETTEAMILNACWALLGDPARRAHLEAGLTTLPDLLEEATRWETAVQSCTRHTTEPVELRGVTIPAGDTVQCLLGAANRDPMVFPDPDRFDPGRPNLAAHLAFGSGRHFCLGAALARMEALAALEGLLGRWPGVRLLDPVADAPVGAEFRKPPRLRAVLVPA